MKFRDPDSIVYAFTLCFLVGILIIFVFISSDTFTFRQIINKTLECRMTIGTSTQPKNLDYICGKIPNYSDFSSKLTITN
jgi:hypothetical protein